MHVDTLLLINWLYLLAAVLFILGLKRLTLPTTARSGNQMAALAMFIAVIATLLNQEIIGYATIAVGILIGSAIGVVMARTIKMTAMPQMVAIFNGFGGGASALVASAEFSRVATHGEGLDAEVSITIMLGTLIGSVTFSGSLIAFGKLQDLVTSSAVRYPMQQVINLVIFLVILGIVIYLVSMPIYPVLFIALVVLAMVLGILLVMPIGGADMPVVIALLNSYSGLAAVAAGFVLSNMVLIISGSLVGASGLILTQIMCRAMNRSLVNVMFGAFGAASGGMVSVDSDLKAVRDSTTEDVAIALAYARSVIFVPGYGLAVAQAQHDLRDLADLLEGKGIRVKYAIHPVAGRMPGHMNVLLAEANVPYNQLYDLDDINDEFDKTDVAVVVGANDVTNPAARDMTDSPIYGMPILNVDKAKAIVVIKRSLSPGFAGIDNDLFYLDRTMMYFGDAKEGLARLNAEIANL